MSDTGQHKVVVIDIDELVIDAIGRLSRGFQDGDYNSTGYHAPQGLVWCDDMLHVVDTENHAIRKVETLGWLYWYDCW